jgi:adenine/guanine phosphoribosyltransferase-like PRPP-binding protein
MNAIDAIRERIKLVPGVEGRRHLVHPLNGRFHPVDHKALDALVQALASRVDLAGVDYVLGFPEGGSIPAYAFARLVDRPLILASRLPLDLPGRITFEQPGARLGTTQYLHGLSPGHHVVIVEDELTSGVSAVNAVRALRAGGVVIGEIAALFVIDHPSLWRRLDAERVTLHATLTLPPEYAPRSIEAETG